MASTFLSGVGLANFRGLPEEMQYISPFRDMNFFIGPNNSGKSTILAFIAGYLGKSTGSRAGIWSRQFEELDVRLGKGSSEVKFALAVRSDDVIAEIDSRVRENLRAMAIRVIRALDNNGVIWMESIPPDGSMLMPQKTLSEDVAAALEEHEWQHLWGALTGQSRGSLSRDWIPQTISNLLMPQTPSYPAVHFIPAIREIAAAGSDFSHSGEGLIEKLAELQNPPHDQREKKEIFKKINLFLAIVTGKENSLIEIPYDRRHILVHMDGKVLPLSSLGTGIQEVIMIASFCTLLENQIVCIEEPEIHLHPLLQRKLVRYLRDKTSNQYFIATHSASMIDSVVASVFNVSSEDGNTSVRLALNPNERYEICRQLGYKASDMLQANAIIWVEGPSDRILINHWLHGVNASFVEGLHYSIMFYGGRLLSHLSANDPEVDEFISLRRLNRNVFVVMDSDKKSAKSPINDTKKRIVHELGMSHCWVTKGREIENYIPVALVNDAMSEQVLKFDVINDVGQYAHRLHFRESSSQRVFEIVDKVKVAKFVASRVADYSELDLRHQVDLLTKFINSCNDI